MTVVKQLEKDIERACVRRARLAGWIVYKIKQSDPRGLPDRIFCLRETPTRARRTVLIEFKRAGGRPSVHQETAIQVLQDAGNEVYVVRSVEEFHQIMGFG